MWSVACDKVLMKRKWIGRENFFSLSYNTRTTGHPITFLNGRFRTRRSTCLLTVQLICVIHCHRIYHSLLRGVA